MLTVRMYDYFGMLMLTYTVHLTSYNFHQPSFTVVLFRFHHLLFYTASLVSVLHLVCASTTAINTILNIERIELPNCKT